MGTNAPRNARRSTRTAGSAVALALMALAGACVIRMDGLNVSGIATRESAERVETRPLELAPGETLTLDAGFGDVVVAASADGRAELVATVRARGRTKEEAEAVLARYALVIERGPDGPLVRLGGEPLRVRDGRASGDLGAHADFDAVVPHGTRIVARSGSGDVTARGALGACRLETGYGEVAAAGVRGDLFAKSGSGDVQAKDVEGGTIQLDSGYGAVGLAGARADRIALESGSGDVELDDARAGTVALETSYGTVHARKVHGDLRVQAGSGDVRLHGVHGAVAAESGYGSVEIDGILAGLAATSGSGDVVVRARPGSTSASGWALHSGYGSVALHVPDDFGCAIEARTDYGDLECEFPITIEAGRLSEKRKLRGTVGSGGGTVKLTAGSGDVALKKL